MQADTRTIPEERAKFEAWARGLEFPLLLRRLTDDRRYESLQTEYAWEAWQAARSTVRAPVDASAQEAAPQQGEILRFLVGEGLLDGVWFGDPHPNEQGAFWWRKHLRAAFATSLQQHDQQEGAV